MPHTRAMDNYGYHSYNCHARKGTGYCNAHTALCRSSNGEYSYMYPIAEEPLAPWERELLNSRPHREGEGDVVFTRTDGTTVKFENVEVDSVTPMAEVGDVIGFNYFESDRIIHVPFVSFWEFTYKY